MSTWEKSITTEKGFALQAKLHSGTTLSITRATVGASAVTADELDTLTAVPDERQELTFSTVSYPEDSKCAIPLKLTNTGITEDFVAKVIGIYAFDPDEGEILYMVSRSVKGTEVPPESEMPYTSMWNFYIKYGQADGVEVIVDPAGSVTMAEVNAAVTDHANDKKNPHGVTAAQVGLGNVDNTADSNKYVKYASTSGTADKTKNAITVHLNSGQVEGTSQFTFNGSTAKSINVTPEKIGAAEASHNHDASETTSGTFNIARIPTITAAKGGTGATNGATGLKNLFAAGNTILSSYQYGTSLPSAGNKGRIFFKKVT